MASTTSPTTQSASSFSQTLQFITEIKLQELEKERLPYQTHAPVIDEAKALGKKGDVLQQVEVLAKFVKSWTGTNVINSRKVVGDSFHLTSFKFWLQRAKEDPSFSLYGLLASGLMDEEKRPTFKAFQEHPTILEHKVLHIVTTECYLKTALHGSRVTLCSDLEWFVPSLPHTSILTVLVFLGMFKIWQNFITASLLHLYDSWRERAPESRFVFDQNQVDQHIVEMRGQLTSTNSGFGRVNAYNKYMAFFMRTFGRIPANCRGQAHVVSMIDTFARIQRELFPETGAGGAIGYLRKVLKDCFDATDLPNHFPIGSGGCTPRMAANPPMLG
ncbi:hypothetical protein GALMADRAFT_278519 [Galerina marginata CBS 339.88]|uniref:Uncharacterized protein n=1 Tax=Galerina marginata (strain CBS 339.88) TaxID=685588 RepID=A0A067TGW8_GALM3|nr:hypothetical protein GALMADRAFT_278519 [Galerina marginata CBS 339.88]